jgi:solute carrier family 36 (proton-coupled amino acid transporter)
MLHQDKNRIFFRTGLVVFSAFVAFSVPDFGKFLKLVGSSICNLLGFILPSYFHLKAVPNVPYWQTILNTSLMIGGALFGTVGTIQAFNDMINGELEAGERVLLR